MPNNWKSLSAIKYRIILLLPILSLIPRQAVSQSVSAIERNVNEVLQSNGMTNASMSVMVYNISKNQTVYSYHPQLSLIPGSLNKIFTTAVGFEQLGTDFRFCTKLCYDGSVDRMGTLHGNIYIIGGGDPMLGSNRFKQTMPDTLFASWKRAMESKGIHQVDGRIYYYTGIYDNHPLHDSWAWGDIGNYYGAGVYGLNFHENMYTVRFAPGKRIGSPSTVVQIEPKDLNVKSNNEVTTAGENSGDQVIIYGDPQSSVRRYCGTVPLGKPFDVRGAMPTPPRSCAELFSEYLRLHNMHVSNNASECVSLPDRLNTVMEYYSNTYYVIAQYTNQTSNNIYAESIFKYLGYNAYHLGTFANGSKCINQFFKNNNLKAVGVNVLDGSGLSRLNLVTAEFVCRFLTVVQMKPFYNDFRQSLSKVRESGTARNLLRDLPSDVEIYVKSGTLTGVKSYAGYFVNRQGDLLCFCVIVNNHTCSAADIKNRMEKVLRPIALYQPAK